MDELHERLAVPPDPAFHDRLGAELVARLAAGAATSDLIEEFPVLDIDTSPRRRRLGPAVLGVAAVAVLAVVAAVVAVSRRGDPQPLGPNRPATGAPVTVGFLAEDANGADARAARAAARYVNEHLGGIRGRPLELDVCAMGPPVSASQPEAAACADRFVANGVPVVLHGSSIGLATPEGILTNLGVPLVTDQGAALDGGGSGGGTYRLGNYLSGGSVPAALAAEEGARNVLVIVAVDGAADGDQMMFGLDQSFTRYYERAGVPFTTTADASAGHLRTALAGVDQVQVLGQDDRCASTLRTVRDVGFTGPIAVAYNCATPAVAKEAAGAMAGVRLVDDRVPTAGDDDAVLYRRVLAAHDPTLDTSLLLAASGYRVVLALAEVMGDQPGDVTAAAVRAAFDGAGSLPVPLSLGQTFRCDGKQVVDQIRYCSRAGIVSTLDADGNVTSSKVVDLTRILAP